MRVFKSRSRFCAKQFRGRVERRDFVQYRNKSSLIAVHMGCVPLASSSSTSWSCSAAMLNSAVTLYRLVLRFVRRRREPVGPGEPGSGDVGVPYDMTVREGDL